jgi:hypothetical protein
LLAGLLGDLAQLGLTRAGGHQQRGQQRSESRARMSMEARRMRPGSAHRWVRATRHASRPGPSALRVRHRRRPPCRETCRDQRRLVTERLVDGLPPTTPAARATAPPHRGLAVSLVDEQFARPPRAPRHGWPPPGRPDLSCHSADSTS